MSGVVRSFSEWLRGSTNGTGGSIWFLLLQQKAIKVSHFFICWTGKALAKDEDLLLDYKAQLFWQINICVVIVILVTVQI